MWNEFACGFVINNIKYINLEYLVLFKYSITLLSNSFSDLNLILTLKSRLKWYFLGNKALNARRYMYITYIKNIGITNIVARLGMTLGSIVSIKLFF